MTTPDTPEFRALWITFASDGEPMYAHADEREAAEAVDNGGMARSEKYLAADDDRPRLLTDDEREALEFLLGAGIIELGDVSDVTRSACEKLGLSPIDWHGDRILEPRRPDDEDRA